LYYFFNAACYNKRMEQAYQDPTQTPPVEASTEEAGQPETSEVPKLDLTEPFSWQATEGVSAARGGIWYIAFAIVVIGLMSLAIFAFKSVTFAVLLLVMAVAVIVLSNKPPRIINYAISPKGVYVIDKLHDFSEFRAFGVSQETGYHSIILLPVKRFSPGLTLYFNEQDGERIVDLLGARLPLQEVKPDSLEKFIRLIKL